MRVRQDRAAEDRKLEQGGVAPLALPTGENGDNSLQAACEDRPEHVNVMQTIGIVMMVLFLHLFFAPWRRFGRAVEGKAFPEAAQQLGQIRRIVAINLALGLLTVAVGASGRFW